MVCKELLHPRVVLWCNVVIMSKYLCWGCDCSNLVKPLRSKVLRYSLHFSIFYDACLHRGSLETLFMVVEWWLELGSTCSLEHEWVLIYIHDMWRHQCRNFCFLLCWYQKLCCLVISFLLWCMFMTIEFFIRQLVRKFRQLIHWLWSHLTFWSIWWFAFTIWVTIHRRNFWCILWRSQLRAYFKNLCAFWKPQIFWSILCQWLSELQWFRWPLIKYIAGLFWLV